MTQYVAIFAENTTSFQPMFKVLELSGLFVYLGGLVKIFSSWGDRKNCWDVVC